MESTLLYQPDRAYLEIRGADSRDFLHSILTNNIKKLPEGTGCYSLILTPKGKMITDLYCYCCEDHFGIDVAAERKEILIQTLKNYIILRKAEIIEKTEWGMVTVFGGQAQTTLAKLLPNLPTQPCQYNSGQLSDLKLFLIHKILWSFPAFEVWTRREDLGRLKAKLNFPEITPEAAEMLRIESATPKFSVDMDENTIPQEANLQTALSFDKGCYVGQEVVTRLEHRGHVGKQLVQIKLREGTVPLPGEKIFDRQEKEVGIITSSCFSNRWKTPLALGLLRYSALSQIEILVGEKRLPGVVLNDPKKPDDN